MLEAGPKGETAEAEDTVFLNGPKTYVVTRGFLLIKRGESPQDSDKVMKVQRPIGAAYYTTGMMMKGKNGGLWAKVDPNHYPNIDPAWVLTEGQGVAGILGPLLVDSKEKTQLIKIRWCKDPPIFSVLMKETETVGHLVRYFCTGTGLNRKETILTKGLPRMYAAKGIMLPLDYTLPKDVLNNWQEIGEAGIKDGVLNLVYVGHFDEDYAPRPFYT